MHTCVQGYLTKVELLSARQILCCVTRNSSFFAILPAIFRFLYSLMPQFELIEYYSSTLIAFNGMIVIIALGSVLIIAFDGGITPSGQAVP